MLKRAFQVAFTFGLLSACYAGYVRGFELVERRLAQAYIGSETVVQSAPSSGVVRAAERADKHLGKDHWAAQPDVLKYYDSDRGFWMYFLEFERLKDGKQVEFRPFAVIWDTENGKGTKIATSESARIDLDQPLNMGVGPGTGAMKVIHAKLERDVRIRDDKGTADPTDDLKIGPLTSIEYDEATLQITSDSEVVMEDRDLRLTGIGLMIQLRPQEKRPAVSGSGTNNPGFNGAQTIIVKKNVFININDVGNDGILPNPSKPEQQKQGKTPIELRCDLAMRIDLPKPATPVRIGPPAPTGPTIAHFSRNVEVLRGIPDVPRDRLSSDSLHLTLTPGLKKRPDGEVEPATDEEVAVEAEVLLEDEIEGKKADQKGPLTELTLREAVAEGHNVQLVSAANGMKARCRQLIHKKLLPFAADETYLRGDATTMVIVEKTDIAKDGPQKGEVTGYTHIKTIDAKIFDEGKGDQASTIVARGPGELESHPGIDKPVERRAKWNDQLTLQNINVTEKVDPAHPELPPVQSIRKLITLTGTPSFDELPSQTTLNAKSTLVLRLKPKTPIDAEKDSEADPGEEKFEIENLVALDDVNLISPGNTVHARERLDAMFSPDPSVVRTDATVVKPATPDAKPAAPKPPVDPKAVPAPKPNPAQTPKPEVEPDAPAKPAEPRTTAVADRVWASIYLKPKGPATVEVAQTADAPKPEPEKKAGIAGNGIGGQDADINKVFMRGNVTYHQDAPAGKVKGTDVSGQAIDLLTQAKDVHKFIVFHLDPALAVARTKDKDKDAETAEDSALVDLAPLAMVSTDEMTMKGEVITLDQAANIATVDGRGSLTTLTGQGLLGEKAVASRSDADAQAVDEAIVQARLVDEADPNLGPKAPPKKKTPLTITWKQGMKFIGDSTNPQGRKVAVAEFYDRVHAFTEDADMRCLDVMRTYMDKPVKLIQVRRDPKLPPEAKPKEEPRADLAMIECVEEVVIENIKLDPKTRAIVQKQRIRGNYVIYHKSSGKFNVPGAGIVDLYERQDQTDDKQKLKIGQNRPAGDAKVIRTAGPSNPPLPRPNPDADEAPVVGHGTGGRNFDVMNPDKPLSKGRKPKTAKPKVPPPPPLILTTIKFKRQMIGRFGTGEQADKNETRWADFFGDVETIRGTVKSNDDALDPDAPPTGAQFLTAQVLRVISEPMKPDANSKATARYLLKAWENAYATVDDRTIQADTITFDSLEENFFAYGLDGNHVVIAQQTQQGQPGSVVDGRAAFYNHKTGASELIDPSKLALFDAQTGKRPAPENPIDPKLKPVKPKRSQFRNPRMSTERKDFRGT